MIKIGKDGNAWHICINDPADMPTENGRYLTYNRTKRKGADYCVRKFENGIWLPNYDEHTKVRVLAWRCIEHDS